jgi:hypothetical protein
MQYLICILYSFVFVICEYFVRIIHRSANACMLNDLGAFAVLPFGVTVGLLASLTYNRLPHSDTQWTYIPKVEITKHDLGSGILNIKSRSSDEVEKSNIADQ